MNKNAYVDHIKAQLDEWSADLDKLDAKARGASADARIKYEEQLASLRRQRDDARQKLDELQSAAGDAWEQFKQDAEATWKRLGEAVTRAKAAFK